MGYGARQPCDYLHTIITRKINDYNTITTEKNDLFFVMKMLFQNWGIEGKLSAATYVTNDSPHIGEDRPPHY